MANYQAIIKTAIENKQNLIIEGFYIPYNYSAYFTEQKLSSIDYHCLVMTPTYIENNFTLILKHSNVIETRIVDSNVTKEMLTAANQRNLEQCQKYGHNVILIKENFEADLAKHFNF